MAKLKFKIDESSGKDAIITIAFTSDIDFNEVVKTMREVFELEMLSADISPTLVRFETGNKEKVEMVRNRMIKAFRVASNLNDINLN